MNLKREIITRVAYHLDQEKALRRIDELSYYNAELIAVRSAAYLRETLQSLLLDLKEDRV